MASQLEPLARELECGVCLEVLREPKILDCSHTFCRACLQGLTGPNARSITCPLCQQSTIVPPGGVGALKSNLLARSMIEALTTMNPESVEVGQEATESTTTLPPQLRHPNSGVHPPLDVRGLTAGPTLSSTGSGANNLRSETKNLVELLKGEWANYENTLQIVKEREEDFSAAAARAREDVSAAADSFIADVRRKQQEILRQVNFIASTRKEAIERHKVGIQGVLQGVGVSPGEMENLDSKDEKAIVALSQRLKYNLERMKLTPPPSADVTDGLSFLKFTAEKTPAFNLYLGDLLEEQQWCLDLKFGKYGSEIGQFNCARGVAISPCGDMAITEQRNNRTCIFGTDGKHKLTMTGKSSGNPDRGDRDVAFLSDGRCLILGKTSNIEVYDSNGGRLNSILTPVKSPWCLAVDTADTIYLGDLEKKLIYVMVDGLVTRQIQVAHKPLNLAVDNKGHILVSSATSKRVEVLDIATGEELFSISPKSVDPSNLVTPWGACFGSDGSIFVAFYNSSVFYQGTVHEFGRDGRHLSCVARGFHAPRNVEFTRDGRLIVVDGTSIKLYRKV